MLEAQCIQRKKIHLLTLQKILRNLFAVFLLYCTEIRVTHAFLGRLRTHENYRFPFGASEIPHNHRNTIHTCQAQS